MKEFLNRYKETVSYLIAGILAVLVNTGTFLVLYRNVGFHEISANTIAFFLTVFFAYWTNSRFVFCVPCTRKSFLQFFGMRMGTIFIDNGGIFLLIDNGMNDMLAKCIVNLVIIAINYLLSKLIIFKKNGGEEST